MSSSSFSSGGSRCLQYSLNSLVVFVFSSSVPFVQVVSIPVSVRILAVVIHNVGFSFSDVFSHVAVRILRPMMVSVIPIFLPLYAFLFILLMFFVNCLSFCNVWLMIWWNLSS